ncbi:MAG TPA: DUF116 domain-containing protein [Candidatus Hypogeohydataceae bacterium YC38]|nr:DUF116 domain-containing protein [Candidatus Brocadiales bacterium]
MTLGEVIDSKVVSLSNLINRLKGNKCPPSGLLIMFPHCIQWSKCPQKITLDLNNCKRCGKCKVKDLIELSEKYGVQLAVATGGRAALERVKSEEVRGVVAIACEKELRIGLTAAFPKAILSVPNLRPHGYCKDTDVVIADVEQYVRQFLEEPSPSQSSQ